jgi:hypothetical protein
MHRSDEIPQSDSMEPTMEVQISEPDGSLTSRWTTMASAAAGAALGMPFDSRTAFRAAWVEVSQWIAAIKN